MNIGRPTIQDAPSLETGRLILQGHSTRDLDANLGMWSNPSVVEYIARKPSTREESWSRILRYAGHWRLLGYGSWAVREKNSGRFVGDVGFLNAKRAMSPSLDSIPEVGWVLDPAFHGKGYATEAVKAALLWGDVNLPSGRTACMVSPDNIASLQVARKCGYKEFARTTYTDSEVILFQRDRH